MIIDILHFTPWPSFAGGVLIGLAAALSILLVGRVAGISGILGGLLRPARGDIGWRAAFVAGLFAAPWLMEALGARLAPSIDATGPALVVAGLLVGYGTRLGSGCTSGHGVCGISRLSPRSFTATALFVGAGFVTVYLLRHGLG